MTNFAMNVLAGIAALLPLQSVAQDAEDFRIGNETRKSTGVVKQLVNGDAACYITLQDDLGVEFTELGDFAICFQKPALEGKRVSLKYKLENVIADECQGDPACKKSKRVAVVSEARIINAGASHKTSRSADATGQASFCTPSENVVFACRTGAKLASVCASADGSRSKGYLGYRFGKPDAAKPLEISLLLQQPASPASATGATLTFAGGGGAWLRMRNHDYAYVVYTSIGKFGPNEETRTRDGIVVERGGKVVASLKCKGDATSLLGPEWFEQNGIQAHAEDFDLPD